MIDRRHYAQFCGLAAGLDIVGERWTLLIVRELLIGPARFTEIMNNLPGAGPNLLSDRLRSLTERGIIESCPVPGDGRGKQYQLTPLGEELRTPVLMLARWGMRFLDNEHVAGLTSRGAWGFLAVQAMINGRPVPQVAESYQFTVDQDVFHIRTENGQAYAHRGPAENPAIEVTTDAVTFIHIGAEMMSPFEAVVSGRLRMDGDPEALQRCIELMGLAATAQRHPA